ncbi:MAG: BlaI/MecI/CopY family transcriptional regulator [Clostridia bacterium]|nr:BlaI/MecI/CopY family transcriptional regulator [Clostridia bacterium]
MKEYPSLSSNDKVIMDLVWEDGEASTASILEKLEGSENWTRHTVKTYLLRLEEKKLLQKVQISARKIKFLPAISKEEYLAGDASQYLNSHFKGLKHMVASFVDNEMISDEELDDLEKYIREIKDNR